MLLSKLVYLSVKNTIYFDDISFTYDNFVTKFDSYIHSVDYGQNILNVFTPINEAIARLNDLHRIPYKIEEKQTDGRTVDAPDRCKQVISVAYIDRNRFFSPLAWRKLGKRILLLGNTLPTTVMVEYKEDIKAFDETSFVYQGSYSKDEDLEDYNIDDSMCQYIIEYVQGKLYEPIDADIANMHIIRAEQYFANIDAVSSAFAQLRVSVTYKIED